ncbi:hypothetical protein ABFX02_11G019000 [Erythranthe guttata]
MKDPYTLFSSHIRVCVYGTKLLTWRQRAKASLSFMDIAPLPILLICCALYQVDIWEERKVFGSRGQNLKNEIVGKSPPINNAKNSNPIKVMKRDATSLRVKLAVGGLPERILTSLQLVHDEAVKEEVALNKYRSAVSNVREIEKDVVHASSQGNMNGSDVVDNIQKQENIIQHCVTKLENSEAVRAALVSQLREALQDQESKLEQIRSELLVARGQIEQAANMRQQLITSTSSTAPTAVSQPIMVDPTFNTSMPMPMPVPPPTYPLTSFASSGEEETKKATAAAVAAKLAASTSSAQMLTSILSSLVAEEAASMSSGLKRPKLEPPMQFSDAKNTSDGANTAYFTSGTTQPLSQLQPPFLPPPPPVAPLPANPMMGMPYGYGVSNLMPPNGGPMGFAMPPQQQQQQQHQQQQQQVGQNQQGQPQQPTSGGYYRPIGVGFYGQSHQPPTPPIHRQ